MPWVTIIGTASGVDYGLALAYLGHKVSYGQGPCNCGEAKKGSHYEPVRRVPKTPVKSENLADAAGAESISLPWGLRKWMPIYLVERAASASYRRKRRWWSTTTCLSARHGG